MRSLKSIVRDERRKRIKRYTLFVVITLVGIVISMLTLDFETGRWLICAYAILVLVLRLNSRYTFLMALFALVMVPFLRAMNRELVSNSYATYTYLLLLIGVATAAVELWADNRQRSKSDKWGS